MKKLLFTVTLGITLAFGSHSAFAQAKKKAAAPAAEATKVADAEKAKVAKPLPMYSRADEIDAAGKTFTQVNKDGKKVKHVVTDKTVIKNGDKEAKFEDIKVGDTVSGLRLKTNDTEWEVVKITKFGAPAAKKSAAKPAAKPDAAK
jgi:uncharacterized cupredoxin-like copper-binding protein